MTAVIGIATGNGKVIMGGDSAAVQGEVCRPSKLKKVFRRGPFLIGYTTSFRMGQLIQHELEVPPQGKTSDMKYMVTEFAEKTRILFQQRGIMGIENNQSYGGEFLIGYKGRIYTMFSDFQVNETASGWDAIGCGAEVMLGAMAALKGVSPMRRIRRALEISGEINTGVCGPFHIMSM